MKASWIIAIMAIGVASLMLQSCGVVGPAASLLVQEDRRELRRETRRQNKAARIIKRAQRRAQRLDPDILTRDSITLDLMVKVPTLSGSIEATTTFTPPLGKYRPMYPRPDAPVQLEPDPVFAPQLAEARFDFADSNITASIFFPAFFAHPDMPPPQMDYDIHERQVQATGRAPVNVWQPQREVPRERSGLETFLMGTGIFLWIGFILLIIITLVIRQFRA